MCVLRHLRSHVTTRPIPGFAALASVCYSCQICCRYIALQRDPRFEAVYSQYLKMFDSLGLLSSATPYMHYSSAGLPSKYGSWGLIEYTGQDPTTAPKYRAVSALIKSKLPASTSPGCMDYSVAYRGLQEGTFAGVPAVMAPAKGSVWVQVCL
jgi:hypothetical protein